MAKLGVGDELTEDSMDPPSVGSDSCPVSKLLIHSLGLGRTPSNVKIPLTISSKRVITPYVVYSNEVREDIVAKHPDATFDEVTRIVANVCFNLPPHVKSEYEERSKRRNEESAAEWAEKDQSGNATPGDVPSRNLPRGLIFECFWKQCDWQGKEIGELTKHLFAEPHSHVLTTINPNGNQKLPFSLK